MRSAGPSVEALIADAGNKLGHGWVFGFNEALDQAGATIGPLITALVLYLQGGFHRAFAFLLIPALLCFGNAQWGAISTLSRIGASRAVAVRATKISESLLDVCSGGYLFCSRFC